MYDYLSKVEQDKIAVFNNDKVLFEAIKKVILKGVYSQGTLSPDKPANPMLNAALGLVAQTQNGVIANERLGEDLRAFFEGAKMVEVGFAELAKIKSKEEVVEPSGNVAI